MEILISEWFDSHEKIDCFYATAGEIKNKWYAYNNAIGLAWLRRVIKDELEIQPEKQQRYISFNETMTEQNGKPYKFKRSDFVL